MVNLRECVTWYQKKIGTYDREQWETTIEQKIINRLNNVPKNTTKMKRELRTDFIDVDLIRGSSFPKAKPKHGFVTVTKLAIARLLFLPIFAKWWISQTSLRIFLLFLLLYIGQMCNFGIYTLKIVRSNFSSECFEYRLSSEIYVPFVIMLVLSIIHSQIVSTMSYSNNYFKHSSSKELPRGQRRRIIESRYFSNSCDDSFLKDNESQSSVTPEDELNVNWIGSGSNSDEGSSYESDGDGSDFGNETMWKRNLEPNSILNPGKSSSNPINCTIWEDRSIKRAEMSVLDISSIIILRAEESPESMDYLYSGIFISIIFALIPLLYRSGEIIFNQPNTSFFNGDWDLFYLNLYNGHFFKYASTIIDNILGHKNCERIITIIAIFERLFLSMIFFFLLAVAENTFRQRFVLAKLFSHLTSFRRASKSDIPHFRLNKVHNIKAWLSIRSYLKKRGPQRSVDVILSTVFITMFLLLSFISVEFLKDSVSLHPQFTLEVMTWCLGLGVFLLRFMTLGTRINSKYRNLSVLLTEQINLYLQIEKNPPKKDEIMVANNVLKLAADLLKELESPFKISGLSANPHLYTIIKVVILSALSGVFSEILGFKLKLHKIKIK